MLSLLLTLALGTASATPAPASAVPFIENDFARAVSEAKRRRLPIFVDAWAPWCHSCISMRAYVFPDPSLRALAERFVWLSIDTERIENAAFLERFPIEIWPSFLVLEPDGRTVRTRWVGAVEVKELLSRLDATSRDGGVAEPPHSVEALCRSARAEEAAGHRARAVELYRSALELVSTADPEKRGAVIEPLLELLAEAHPRECVELGVREAAELPMGVRRANVAYSALSCALARKPVDRNLLLAAEKQVHAVVDAPPSQLLADNVSGLFELLVSARRAAGDPEGEKQNGLAWAAYLDAAAERSPTPEARAVFDAHRVLAYTAAGLPERALPMLAQSARDFPGDYNPPARTAGVLLAMGRYDDALTASRHARRLVYGPRTLRVLILQSEILDRLGRRSDAKAALREAEALIARLPTGQRHPNHWKMLDEARAKLDR